MNCNCINQKKKKERESFNQAELDDLVRDLILSKELFALLASGLKENKDAAGTIKCNVLAEQRKSSLSIF